MSLFPVMLGDAIKTREDYEAFCRITSVSFFIHLSSGFGRARFEDWFRHDLTTTRDRR
jgi:hypothetical protein